MRTSSSRNPSHSTRSICVQEAKIVSGVESIPLIIGGFQIDLAALVDHITNAINPFEDTAIYAAFSWHLFSSVIFRGSR